MVSRICSLPQEEREVAAARSCYVWAKSARAIKVFLGLWSSLFHLGISLARESRQRCDCDRHGGRSRCVDRLVIVLPSKLTISSSIYRFR